MTESEWLTSTDPAAMLTLLDGLAMTTAVRVPKLKQFRDACSERARRDRPTNVRTNILEREVRLWVEEKHVLLSFAEKAEILRCLFNPFVPPLPRTKAQVRVAQRNAVAGGCCNRFADNMACDCLSEAVQYIPWRTPTVLSLARSIHENNDYDAMPVLADALEEAGMEGTVGCRACSGKGDVPEPYAEVLHQRVPQRKTCSCCFGTGCLPNPILAHCRPERVKCDRCRGEKTLLLYRGPGTTNPYFRDCHKCADGYRLVDRVHARGCWVIDLILGESNERHQPRRDPSDVRESKKPVPRS